MSETDEKRDKEGFDVGEFLYVTAALLWPLTGSLSHALLQTVG